LLGDDFFQLQGLALEVFDFAPRSIELAQFASRVIAALLIALFMRETYPKDLR
jgi:hypothetical protein